VTGIAGLLCRRRLRMTPDDAASIPRLACHRARDAAACDRGGYVGLYAGQTKMPPRARGMGGRRQAVLRTLAGQRHSPLLPSLGVRFRARWCLRWKRGQNCLWRSWYPTAGWAACFCQHISRRPVPDLRCVVCLHYLPADSILRVRVPALYAGWRRREKKKLRYAGRA
jgi:hypothetical protein